MAVDQKYNEDSRLLQS